MSHYYHLDSSGEDTNLQLYSLRQARVYWTELQTDYTEHGERTQRLKERCVFILATLGLSISQLLGQNSPSAGRKVPSPLQIFRDIVATHHLDPALTTQFEQFNHFYNGCRHFGLTTTDSGYNRVDQVTFASTRDCFEFGMKVWRTVIEVYRGHEGSDLEEFAIDDLPEDAEEVRENS